MSKTPLIALAAAASAILAVTAMTAQTSNAGSGVRDAVSCELVVGRKGNTLKISGLVHARAATTGSYRLTVTRSGAGGDADIMQSGTFDIEREGEAALGTVMLDAAGSYVAQLEVSTAGGSVRCERAGDSL